MGCGGSKGLEAQQPTPGQGQMKDYSKENAELKEEVKGLQTKVNDLTIKSQNLEKENSQLRAANKGGAAAPPILSPPALLNETPKSAPTAAAPASAAPAQAEAKPVADPPIRTAGLPPTGVDIPLGGLVGGVDRDDPKPALDWFPEYRAENVIPPDVFGPTTFSSRGTRTSMANLLQEQKTIRKTKIVCTMGPKCWEEDMLGKLLDAGMNIA
eukprot:3152507-Rhodomonas_salina.3